MLPLSSNLITVADMYRRKTERLGGPPSFDRELAQDEAVLQGELRTHTLASGLIIHLARVRDLQDMGSHNLLQPGIKATFLLDGQTRLAYGRNDYLLDSRKAPAVLLGLAEEDRFSRAWSRQRHEAKVCLTLSEQWLERLALSGESAGWLARFRREHLSECPWTPSASALEMARQLLLAPQLDAGLLDLYLESRCLPIVFELLERITGTQARPTALSTRQRQRVERLRQFLDSGEADGLGLQRIAAHNGFNVIDMQRLFSQAQGTTVFAYMKERRMQMARRALLEDGLSVALAAEVAGFGNPANFATAFKRRFGVSPSKLRP
ncbi:helix-turn-helix transcriptional regulator [Pseudomonas sp. ABC1]|uniref:helix-turn-helix transcriptional regulator n=1 Tax=Pseudomonas sp. ABC1 TaxID=2748080 RepID=UPI0015C3ED1A|nr:AraC family transcriptional regulator [Pseudomonas sp. ABC1]QLF93562.1 helix-turn-helix transcriptional regulator [Pseudomonas sp. ABC1]